MIVPIPQKQEPHWTESWLLALAFIAAFALGGLYSWTTLNYSTADTASSPQPRAQTVDLARDSVLNYLQAHRCVVAYLELGNVATYRCETSGSPYYLSDGQVRAAVQVERGSAGSTPDTGAVGRVPPVAPKSSAPR